VHSVVDGSLVNDNVSVVLVVLDEPLVAVLELCLRRLLSGRLAEPCGLGLDRRRGAVGRLGGLVGNSATGAELGVLVGLLRRVDLAEARSDVAALVEGREKGGVATSTGTAVGSGRGSRRRGRRRRSGSCSGIGRRDRRGSGGALMSA